MSNINNKHIPEDLDSLTRKDMVELFKIQVEEHQGFLKEIETLRAQLAKANERVKELEKERDRSQRMYNSLLGGLSAGYGELSISECENHLNKFAIEQKIEVLESLSLNPNNESEDRVVAVIDERIAQLRKEQGE